MTHQPHQVSPGHKTTRHIHRGGRRKVLAESVAAPLEALKRRGEAAGMDSVNLRWKNKEILHRVSRDSAMATALGRVMWAFDACGQRRRRMMPFGPQKGREALITDDMENAALAFQRLWFAWQVACGMPRRTTKALNPNRIKVDGGPLFDGACHKTAAHQNDDHRAEKTTQQLRRAHAALDRCPRSAVVRQVIDMILIDDVLPPQMLDRPQAIGALRAGLSALNRVLINPSTLKPPPRGTTTESPPFDKTF